MTMLNKIFPSVFKLIYESFEEQDQNLEASNNINTRYIYTFTTNDIDTAKFYLFVTLFRLVNRTSVVMGYKHLQDDTKIQVIHGIENINNDDNKDINSNFIILSKDFSLFNSTEAEDNNSSLVRKFGLVMGVETVETTFNFIINTNIKGNSSELIIINSDNARSEIKKDIFNNSFLLNKTANGDIINFNQTREKDFINFSQALISETQQKQVFIFDNGLIIEIFYRRELDQKKVTKISTSFIPGQSLTTDIETARNTNTTFTNNTTKEPLGILISVVEGHLLGENKVNIVYDIVNPSTQATFHAFLIDLNILNGGTSITLIYYDSNLLLKYITYNSQKGLSLLLPS